ncbi:MmpS family transport accessory protein [Mycobacterium vicinigordonae]|uniref:Uncharacterized protein n=1 Tax=Mycobacterium vicinigordonae TaxID=1719132 RepID=A0A7D6E2N8_9MYCO|nr:MmpS family transport accessory protein [Mycobacterium vicinigordonae]QLL05942.1 hypothetical protein H0P51_19385 [Mycobacterium vicinigordonae]
MSDPRRPQNYGPPQQGSHSTRPQDPQDSVVDYPAYADDMPYNYGGSSAPWGPGSYQPAPTQQLPPQYWQQDGPPPDEKPPSDSPPSRSPRWLWLTAGTLVLVVIGLVIALVIANQSGRQQTAFEPLPPMSSPTTTFAPPTTRTAPPSTTRRPPRTTAPPSTTPPDTSTVPGAMQSVVYSVTGEGRAISVVYLDSGDLIQTEFNVTLPWSKQVSLSTSSTHPPSVTVVNIGHNVTCSVTVGGVQVRQRTGQGLTICDAPL